MNSINVIQLRRFASFLMMGVLCSATVTAEEKSKPNILFIAVDDLRPELGCYGTDEIHTPNIDRLAASGVVFQRAYCQLAVCNPSRVSIMTGLRPDSTKVWDLVTRFRETIPDAVTLPAHFRDHGYRAVSFGKVFHNPWPDNRSWSEPHAWPKKRVLWSDQAKQRLAADRKRMREEGASANAINRLRAQATEEVDVPDSEHIDGAIADQTIEALERIAKDGEPFFLATGFVRPHLPFVVPRKYWEMYDPDEIPLASDPDLPKDAPSFAMNTMYELRDYSDFRETLDPRNGSLSLAQQRRLKHGYFAAVSFVDAQIGRVLAALDQSGLADNTIVVLWGDHGWKLGEHNSWCKQTNYEIDTRVPLIIRAPAARANGSQTAALVELVDVYPTLCELAGIPVLKQLEGRSAAPLLSDPNLPWKTAAFSQFPRNNRTLMGYAMRTDRYRYVEWQDRSSRKVVATELYDHESDPKEKQNLAGQPDHQNRLAELSQSMWSQLPEPPALGRPRVIFRNSGSQPLNLFWVRPNGEEQKMGVIQPGDRLVQNTTLGHRFVVRGVGGFQRSYVVRRQSQNINVASSPEPPFPRRGRPNIVVCMADDWSWPHASILGDPVAKTPNFDRVAKEGVLFENAFVSTPSCTPSRLSILTGQHHWRLKEGDSLGGSLRESFPVYTEILQKFGYRIGRFGKGVWPSKHTFRNRDSFGDRHRSFAKFLEGRESDQPFCYWHGGQDPHRPYELGVGARSGIDLSKVRVPDCLPDHETVRSDLADYIWEVQRFDREVGSILDELEAMGELENTIFVVSSDNGMPFPRCKGTLYDLGTRVPLAVRWGDNVKPGRTVTDFVSLCDLAPTFMEAAGHPTQMMMTGRSLVPLLRSDHSGQIDPKRTFALSGLEKHVYSYPSRALRTKDYLYIRNFEPETWQTGEQPNRNPRYDFLTEPWPTEEGAFSFNIDPSPTKQLLRLNRQELAIRDTAALSFDRHPKEELYDLQRDPGQVNNVASEAEYELILVRLRKQLTLQLSRSADPRMPGWIYPK